jgi:hypothetical protein
LQSRYQPLGTAGNHSREHFVIQAERCPVGVVEKPNNSFPSCKHVEGLSVWRGKNVQPRQVRAFEPPSRFSSSFQRGAGKAPALNSAPISPRFHQPEVPSKSRHLNLTLCADSAIMPHYSTMSSLEPSPIIQTSRVLQSTETKIPTTHRGVRQWRGPCQDLLIEKRYRSHASHPWWVCSFLRFPPASN